MPLGLFELAARLNHRYLGIVDQFLRQRSFALQRHAVVVQLLRRIEHLLRHLHVGLRFAPIFGNGRARRRQVGGLRLLELALALVRRRCQVTALQLGDWLSRADVIPAIHEHAFHRRAELGRHIRLIDRIENGVGNDHMVDRASHCGFDGDGSQGFLQRCVLLFALAAAGEQRAGREEAGDRTANSK